MGRIGTIINRKGKQDAKKRQGVYKKLGVILWWPHVKAGLILNIMQR